MEQNTKIIIAAVALGGLGYFLYKKGLFGTKAVAQPIVTPTKIVTTTKTTPPPAPVYPAGFSENDYVKNPSGDGTVYMLKRGQKLPITYAWWMANAKLDWDSVKMMSAPLLMDIPTGNTLDA
jgi:hypothetical protein